eukprot:466475-Rhodomonas_salina.1
MLLQCTTFTADGPALEIRVAGRWAAAKEAVDSEESGRRAGVNYEQAEFRVSLTLAASGHGEVQLMMLEAWDENGKAWDPMVCCVVGHETEGQAGVMTCNCTRDGLFVQLLNYHSSDIIDSDLTSVGARPE